MYIHLKDQQYYEDLYDKLTVEDARRGMAHYDNFFADFESKLKPDDKIDRPGNALLLNAFYMEVVGNELLRRYSDRAQSIREWTERDAAKDAQIASARLVEEPYCQHCGKQGLRIIDKSLMHRSETYKYGDPEEVLFMLRCPGCEKNSAFWEDGVAWKVKPTLCPKCQSEVTHKTSKTKNAITIRYTCTSCKHQFKDVIDTSHEEETPDPDFDRDRVHFCLLDKEFRERLMKMKHDFEEMARLGKEFKEKQDNKHIYDAVKEIKKPKIAELIPLLSKPLEKAGYIEFHLDKPEVGQDVRVGFSCLDSKSDRADYDSRHALKKLVEKTLADTNWRLMSDGIHYRLGYLSGRIRAYEREEDLKDLVMKRKDLKPKPTSNKAADKKGSQTLRTPDGKEVIL